jgi:hypothetical protein
MTPERANDWARRHLLYVNGVPTQPDELVELDNGNSIQIGQVWAHGRAAILRPVGTLDYSTYPNLIALRLGNTRQQRAAPDCGSE